ncbi:MAG: glycine rich domain-containing protein [Mycoplasmatota bacterium]
MKKGFTLIELLAVLVILVVIAAIATPIVMGIIDEAKVSSNISTVDNLAVAAEQLYARSQLNGKLDELTSSNNIFDEIEMSNKPENAIVTLDNNGVVTVIFEKEEKCYIKKGDEDVTYGDTDTGYCDSYFNEFSGTEYAFEYNGDYQLFVVPMSGYYNLEAWGAQGGTYASYVGGSGAYTSGNIYLQTNEKIYVYVGGTGGSNYTTINIGGYNGGGYSGNNSDAKSFGGGGSTDFRLISGEWDNDDSLNSRIMVAAGGAGATTGTIAYGGNAGGLMGYDSATNHSIFVSSTYDATGGTQISPGISYQSTRTGSFGYSIQSNTIGWGGGGGTGYYGGSNGCGRTGAGGSSYISGHTGCVAITSLTDQTPKSGCTTGTTDNECSLHYSDKVFTNTVMIDGLGYSWTNEKGTQTSMPTPSGSEYELGTGNVGDGYAQITYLGVEL